MRVLKGLRAAVILTLFGMAGAATVEAVTPPDLQCSSCSRRSCKLVNNQYRCECVPVPVSTTVTPTYYVTHVVYTPPGKSSAITYGSGSTSGTSTSVSNSFKEGTTATMSVLGKGVAEGTGVKVSATDSWGTTTSNATDITVEQTSTRSVAGKADFVDHGDDEIWFLVKPKLTVKVTPNLACTAARSVDVSFAESPQAIEYFVYLKWLTNPGGMNGLPANVRSQLESFGITEKDFPEMAKAHPFTTFNLVPSHSNQCLAIPAGSQTAGQGAIQYPCLGAGVPDQGYRLLSVGKDASGKKDVVQIIASHSNQCLAVPANSQADGQQVIQYPCLGPSVRDQSWRLVPKGGGRYWVQASHSNKCLAIPAGSQRPGEAAIQYTCIEGVADQLWSLKPVSFQRPTNVALRNPNRPGDFKRFEYVRNFTYINAQPGTTPDPTIDTVTRKVVNTDSVVTDTTRNVGLTIGVGGAGDYVKALLSFDKTWSWTNQTSTKQSDGKSTSHAIKIGQPPAGFNGPTLVHVYHDKLWKTYMFLLDSNQ